MKIGRHLVGIGAVLALALTACGDSEDASGDSSSITLYTCVNDTTIAPVIKTFEKANPGTRSSSSAPRRAT